MGRQVDSNSCSGAHTDGHVDLAFSGMRGYALTKHRGISAAIFIMSVAPFAVNAVRISMRYIQDTNT